MSTTINAQPATIRSWLTERGVTDITPHHIARALGVKRSEVEPLLSTAPTAEALLNLNRLAQVKHLALANRVWPNCSWLAWENHQTEQHPVIDLIRRVFGRESLDTVTPADVYFGRQQEVLSRRDLIKEKTLQQRRQYHRQRTIQAI